VRHRDLDARISIQQRLYEGRFTRAAWRRDDQ